MLVMLLLRAKALLGSPLPLAKEAPSKDDSKQKHRGQECYPSAKQMRGSDKLQDRVLEPLRVHILVPFLGINA